ncbi:hypothetical protein JYU34_022791 [Plutella xylostella]|uniref:DNA-directed DNA polymerase n=3 Tax=Plutella xylostella TaxID=51655 RepID=A0ABQ7PPF3_PLUXY|nr:hypothetical protein JYU34_022791 [Plutella xylostella]
MFCTTCNVVVPSYAAHKKSNIHKSNSLIRSEFDNVLIIATAFKNRILSYRVNPSTSCLSPELFLLNIKDTVCNLIKKSLVAHRAIKINFELYVSYTLPKNEETSIKSFNTSYEALFENSDISSVYCNSAEKLVTKCSEFELSESGWTIDSISHLEVNINKYNPLRAGSFVKLPAKISRTKACLNIQNKDEHCFLWSIMAHLYPAKNNPVRVRMYPHYSKVLNTAGMTFPPSFEDIKLFEKLNPDISINVYGLETNSDVVGPLFKTSSRKLTHVNLLYIDNGGKGHYCLIKNFDRLVRNQLTQHKCKIFLCDECFIYFNSEKKLCDHNCARVKTTLPPEGSKISFSNVDKTQRIPIVIYGDFESLLHEYNDKNKSEHVENIQKHEATCFAYYICCKSNPELNEYVSYRGARCAKKFVETISNDVKRLYQILSVAQPMLPLSQEEKTSFDNANTCYFCEKNFSRDEIKVADHDHFTGKYRGPSHKSCNLKAKVCPFIPIIFHNLSGYDCHLFINELSSIIGRVNLIPKNKEKFISFTKFIPIDAKNVAQLKFIDSFNFLSSGLDKLAKTLSSSDFINLRKYFKDQYLFDLVRRKGIYCYDYVNSWDRYSENQLPERKHFFSKLNSEDVSEEDYKHALNVWQSFNIKNIGEYTDLYLKCDVLLLCDIFEKFRSMSLKYYQLDPCYYISSPSLSWDAMLKFTKVELDLISDLEMYQMIENGIRGGLAQCSLRYAKANNKYLPHYDKNEPNSFLIYLDCVNLYGFAMMKKLPTSNFHFLNDFEIQKFNILNHSADDNQGFILEVDLSYPANIHKEHSDLPFAPEKLVPAGGTTSKLIANLYDKHHYIIHYVHLKECLKHGLKLLKIHKILAFDQKVFLEPYISLNTSLRQKATSDFEKDFFKKQNNSIFGKTIENKRKQVDVKLVTVWKDVCNNTNKLCGAEKYISAPNFKNLAIISENLVAIHLQRTHVILDRPIYIGFSVLELAKTHLYRFHYSFMKPFYDKRIQLCYTDTDSLLYLIYTNDFYEDMKDNIQYFDTSNFEKNNIYKIPPKNMKIPGYFKDELGGEIISEFVGLRAKLYFIDTCKNSIKKAKGIKKSVTKKLQLNQYKKSLFKNESFRDDMFLIRSKNHQIFTQRVNKLILCRSDNKRQILEDKITTLPWGHCNTSL